MALTAEQELLPPEQAVEFVDFRRNFPPSSAHIEGALRDTFSELRSTEGLATDLRFPRFNGTERDRVAGASWLSKRFGAEVSSDQMLISNGTQSFALMILAQLVGPGGIMLTESLTYPAMKPLARLLGIGVRGVEMDEEGILPDALDAACRQSGSKVLHCIPTFQNPTTAVMSPGRRKDIAEVVRRYDLQILEDDIYGVLHEEAPQPLAAFAPERTWYMLGLSKSLSIQLRVTYMLVPEGVQPSQYFWPATMTTNWMVAPIAAEIASRWLQDGTADRLLYSVREETKARQAIAVEMLKGTKLRTHPNCYHIWASLPSGWSSDAFADRMRRLGISISSSRSFAVPEETAPDNFRVGLGVPTERETLRDSLGTLVTLLGDEPY